MIKSMNKDLFEKLCDEGLAYIYVIKLHDEIESFYKIGITSKENTYDRVSSFPYKVEIIDVFCHSSPRFIMDLEKHLLSLEEKYTPLKMFGGYSECVKSADKAVEFLNSLSWMKDFKQHKLLKKHTFSGLVREYLDNLDTGYLDLLKRDKRSAIIEEAIEIFGVDSIRELSQRKISHAILEEKILEYISIFGVDEYLLEGNTKKLAEYYLRKKINAHKDKQKLREFLSSKYEVGDTITHEDLRQVLVSAYESLSLSGKLKLTDINLAFETKPTSILVDGKKENAVRLVDEVT